MSYELVKLSIELANASSKIMCSKLFGAWSENISSGYIFEPTGFSRLKTLYG